MIIEVSLRFEKESIGRDELGTILEGLFMSDQIDQNNIFEKNCYNIQKV
jgi:hypothetical protein